jgi:FkbM family methyltransferase
MIDLEAQLHNSDLVTPKSRELVDAFISPLSDGKRYLFGLNEYSTSLGRVLPIDGYIDDYCAPGTLFDGKPVFNGGQVSKDALIVNCSMSISPVSAFRRIEKIGVRNILAYSDLCKCLPERVNLPAFIDETRKDIQLNPTKWKKLYASLSDEPSRVVLNDLISYRLTGDYSFMKEYSVRFNEQYFEDFLGIKPGEIFVDCGGFDGDTTEEFCSRYPDYKRVYLFEPSATNIEKAKVRLRERRDIEFLPLGVSDTSGSLFFDNAGSASSVSESGLDEIRVTTIDQQITENITFIKMDLEGWEMKALAGAKKHICDDHPKLAIAVYHHPADFWRISEYIFGLRQDYKIYLRHYTEGWSETVMYFIPDK